MFVGETDDKLSQFSSCKDDLSTIIKENCDNWLSVCLNKMLSPLLVCKLWKFDEQKCSLFLLNSINYKIVLFFFYFISCEDILSGTGENHFKKMLGLFNVEECSASDKTLKQEATGGVVTKRPEYLVGLSTFTIIIPPLGLFLSF